MPVPGSFTERDARAVARLREYCGVAFLADFAVRAYQLARFGRGRDPDESELEAVKLADLLWDGFGRRYLEAGGDLREAVEEGVGAAGEMDDGEEAVEGMDFVAGDDCESGGDCDDDTEETVAAERKRPRARQAYHYQLAGEFAQHYLSNALHDFDDAYMIEVDQAEIADKAVRLADAVVDRLRE